MSMENEEQTKALVVRREPAKVLAQAKNAAKMLHAIIAKKPDKVIINNKQYIQLEDWELLGHFYGLSCRVTRTERIEVEGVWGWKAHAEVYDISADSVVSEADAICLENEKNWQEKPNFQVASMAETRACAKAFRLCLSWIVVLAGYAPESAEETEEPTKPKSAESARASGKKGTATQPQINKIWGDAKKMGYKQEDINAIIKKKWGVESVKDLTVPQASTLIDMIAQGVGTQDIEPGG
jgi:hypothetical protein